jgi:hypothetical protein
MDKNNNVIMLHFPLEAVVGYAGKWLEQTKADEKLQAAEKAMCEDIVTVLKVGASVMQQQPTNNNKNGNEN